MARVPRRDPRNELIALILDEKWDVCDQPDPHGPHEWNGDLGDEGYECPGLPGDEEYDVRLSAALVFVLRRAAQGDHDLVEPARGVLRDLGISLFSAHDTMQTVTAKALLDAQEDVKLARRQRDHVQAQFKPLQESAQRQGEIINAQEVKIQDLLRQPSELEVRGADSVIEQLQALADAAGLRIKLSTPGF